MMIRDGYGRLEPLSSRLEVSHQTLPVNALMIAIIIFVMLVLDRSTIAMTAHKATLLASRFSIISRRPSVFSRLRLLIHSVAWLRVELMSEVRDNTA